MAPEYICAPSILFYKVMAQHHIVSRDMDQHPEAEEPAMPEVHTVEGTTEPVAEVEAPATPKTKAKASQKRRPFIKTVASPSAPTVGGSICLVGDN
jgi:hypothetical protein